MRSEGALSGPPNSVSPPCLTSHTTACVMGGAYEPQLTDEKTEASGEEGRACGRAKSSDARAQAHPVPGTQDGGGRGFPRGNPTIRQSEHRTERETEAQKGLATPVTVQAAAILGQNPRQVCPHPRRILKPSLKEPAHPPHFPERSSLQPARLNIDVFCVCHSLPIQSRACDTLPCDLPGGWPKPSPDSDGQSAPIL